MGILSDLLAAPLTFSNTMGVGRHIYKELEDILNTYGDYSYPSGYDAVNEVQSIAVYTGTVDGGTFTLTPVVTGAVATSALAFGASAATIQTAINTAMAGVSGYAAGHLAVTGGNLNTAPLVFTYSGSSVSGRNQSLITANGASLTGGGALGTISTTTHGHTARAAWAILKVLGIITSAPPAQGSSSTPTVGQGRGQYPFALSEGTVRALLAECASKDGGIQAVEDDLKTALEYGAF